MQALITLLDNQVNRTTAALDDLPPDALDHEPGGDCNSIRRILVHLLKLRRFQLTLLQSPLADQVPVPDEHHKGDLSDLQLRLDTAANLLRRAIAEYPDDEWTRVPDSPRDGLWGQLPTLDRFVRPFNDYTNHLGGIRVIRRITGCGVDKTQ